VLRFGNCSASTLCCIAPDAQRLYVSRAASMSPAACALQRSARCTTASHARPPLACAARSCSLTHGIAWCCTHGCNAAVWSHRLLSRVTWWKLGLSAGGQRRLGAESSRTQLEAQSVNSVVTEWPGWYTLSPLPAPPFSSLRESAKWRFSSNFSCRPVTTTSTSWTNTQKCILGKDCQET
jgi:hypothetical protein